MGGGLYVSNKCFIWPQKLHLVVRSDGKTIALFIHCRNLDLREAILPTNTASPIASAGRFSPFGPLGMAFPVCFTLSI